MTDRTVLIVVAAFAALLLIGIAAGGSSWTAKSAPAIETVSPPPIPLVSMPPAAQGLGPIGALLLLLVGVAGGAAGLIAAGHYMGRENREKKPDAPKQPVKA